MRSATVIGTGKELGQCGYLMRGLHECHIMLEFDFKMIRIDRPHAVLLTLLVVSVAFPERQCPCPTPFHHGAWGADCALSMSHAALPVLGVI